MKREASLILIPSMTYMWKVYDHYGIALKASLSQMKRKIIYTPLKLAQYAAKTIKTEMK
jgi:hypothetical protein